MRGRSGLPSASPLPADTAPPARGSPAAARDMPAADPSDRTGRCAQPIAGAQRCLGRALDGLAQLAPAMRHRPAPRAAPHRDRPASPPAPSSRGGCRCRAMKPSASSVSSRRAIAIASFMASSLVRHARGAHPASRHPQNAPHLSAPCTADYTARPSQGDKSWHRLRPSAPIPPPRATSPTCCIRTPTCRRISRSARWW